MASSVPSTEHSARQYVSALSVLAVALFIVLPVWWKTTEVYRCPLPYEEIMGLKNQQVPPEIVYTISVAHLGSTPDSSLESFVSQLQRDLVNGSVSARNVRIKIRYLVKTFQIESEMEARLLSTTDSSSTINDISAIVTASFPSSLGHYLVFLVPSELVKNRPISVENGDSQVFVGQSRHSVVITKKKDFTDGLPAVLKLVKGIYGDRRQLEKALKSTTGLQQERVDIESMRQLRASQGYQLSFTLINPNPSLMGTNWNIEETTSHILLPFLRHPGVASLGNFTVSSQVFYFTDVKFRPRKDSTGSGRHILSSQLPPMISSVESKLASHVSQLPSLNFLVYIPKKSEYPLSIRSSSQSNETTDTFLVPQWGGVVFYNPSQEEMNSDPVNVNVKMENVMPVFVKQLKMLLGITSDLSLPSGTESFQFTSSHLGVTDWQMDHLLTAKMVESISMATTSLISLVSLLDKVKNMVISDHIQKEVQSSLYAVQKCYSLSATGDLPKAYLLAKEAMRSAETAFSDPSILELLYFPDDQKFAIYIPLFLPISFPILLSSVAAFKWLSTSLRTKEKSD